MAGPGLDLDELARVGEVTAQMTAGRMSLAEAFAALEAIDKLKVPFVTQILGGLPGVNLALWLLPVQSAQQAAAVPTLLGGVLHAPRLHRPGRHLSNAEARPRCRRHRQTVSLCRHSLLQPAGGRQPGQPAGQGRSVDLSLPACGADGPDAPPASFSYIILLVSGTFGFHGLAAIAQGQVAPGEKQFLQIFVTAATIAAGLLVGNTLVRPKVKM